MSLYMARRISKLPRRILAETAIELKLLSEKWQLLLAGVIFQYIHGLAARGVHYLHRPGPVLQDLGFMLLPVCIYLSLNFIYLILLLVTVKPIIFSEYDLTRFCYLLSNVGAGERKGLCQ
jgi:hypothetical protein